MLNDLTLLSGNDIPIDEIHLLLHQPTIKEIALIGEEAFFSGCELLRFNKENLNSEDRSRLEGIANFDIIMSIMREKNPSVQKQVACAMMVLSLLFPTYSIQVNYEKMSIDFKQEEMTFSLDENNYYIFVKVLN